MCLFNHKILPYAVIWPGHVYHSDRPLRLAFSSPFKRWGSWGSHIYDVGGVTQPRSPHQNSKPLSLLTSKYCLFSFLCLWKKPDKKALKCHLFYLHSPPRETINNCNASSGTAMSYLEINQKDKAALHMLIGRVDAEESRNLPGDSYRHLQVKPNDIRRRSAHKLRAEYGSWYWCFHTPLARNNITISWKSLSSYKIFQSMSRKGCCLGYNSEMFKRKKEIIRYETIINRMINDFRYHVWLTL